MDKKDYVEEYIEILQDMCILPLRAYRQQEAVENILMACKDQYEMWRKLHDVIKGDITLKQLINQNGGNS